MSTSALLATVRQKYEALAPLLHEKAQRRWAACEARALGRGGISLVAAATGLSRPPIHRGLAELHSSPPPRALPNPPPPPAAAGDPPPRAPPPPPPGGARPRLTTRDPSLLKDLLDL